MNLAGLNLETLMVGLLFAFLAIIGVAVARGRELFTVVMLFSIYSLVSASLFLLLDAADVAFTEAAVGAGISTLLMLATLSQTGRTEKTSRQQRRGLLPLVVVVITGATLVYGIIDLPTFGAGTNPAHQHVAAYYLRQTAEEIGIPNVVTAILASYRGFDTLGEVFVIFTAGMTVLLLIGRQAPSRRTKEDEHE